MNAHVSLLNTYLKSINNFIAYAINGNADTGKKLLQLILHIGNEE